MEFRSDAALMRKYTSSNLLFWKPILLATNSVIRAGKLAAAPT
jgi:hypothetical protein